MGQIANDCSKLVNNKALLKPGVKTGAIVQSLEFDFEMVLTDWYGITWMVNRTKTS